jgi:uncharacterized protein YndB with AHSA1/START domain
MITSSIEIDRRPEDVFAYINEVERHHEWQPAILSARREPAGPVRVGTRNIETRRVPGGPQEFVSEIIELDPPRRIVFQGLNGPIRPRVAVTIAPLGDGSRSRYTLELEFVGHGIGKLFAIMARREASKTVPQDQARLKAIMEKRT